MEGIFSVLDGVGVAVIVLCIAYFCELKPISVNSVIPKDDRSYSKKGLKCSDAQELPNTMRATTTTSLILQ